MNDRNLEDARRLFEQARPAQNISEYEIEEQRRLAVFEKLKQQRREREMAAE